MQQNDPFLVPALLRQIWPGACHPGAWPFWAVGLCAEDDLTHALEKGVLVLTGEGLSELKIPLSRSFLHLSGYVPLDDLLRHPHSGRK